MKSDAKIRCVTRVVLTVEIASASWWGADCTVKQIHTSAAREATDDLTRILQGTRALVVGEPKVSFVSSSSDD